MKNKTARKIMNLGADSGISRRMMANIVTCFRIVCSMILLFCHPFRACFYLFYISAGISDMLDGFIARKTNTVSTLGSTLDTVADFIFCVICLVKLYPFLHFFYWLKIWILLVAFIKLTNAILGLAILKKIITVHSVISKITGLLLFVLPLIFNLIDLSYCVAAICAIATGAAVYESSQVINEARKKRKTAMQQLWRTVY